MMDKPANKQTIVADIRKTYGNMLNIQQVAAIFNCNRKTVPKFVEGLPCYQMGREKKYLAIDIATRIENSRVMEMG